MTMAAGFLEEEGLEAHYDQATADNTVEKGIHSGEIQVAQSAVAVSFVSSEKTALRHFAQINQRDGFFLTARGRDRDLQTTEFDWHDLIGKRVLVDHFFQPMAMFRYALHKLDIDIQLLSIVDAGDVNAIDQAFRSGQGDFVHQQGPFAQQLEADGLGQVVARVGDVVGPVAFSSLCASPDWLATDMARAFMRAYRKGRAACRHLPAEEIARLERGYFPEIKFEVLIKTIAAYQSLGCWDGEPDISHEVFENTLDVFEFSGDITRRIAWQDVICPPPDRNK
jgi:NitT/TauT family transport system substrate-binding protein